jgi:trehalose 6-phosphate synthase/phosphatase
VSVHPGPAPPIEPARAPGAPRPGALVVVSNRLPFTVERRPEGTRVRRSAGGLVAALEPALAARGGTWVGWSGAPHERAAATGAGVEGAGGEVLPSSGRGAIRYRPVALSTREVAQYYSSFSNRTLWPLFHYFVGRTFMDSSSWRTYDRVNERFAREAEAEVTGDALVWVHDYQLLRVPHHLRAIAPRRRIAFFLHIPFPAYDVFRLLPWCRELLRGMLSADLVGVHVRPYAEQVMLCAERLLGCEVDRQAGIVTYEGRPVAVQAHPIGIDVDLVERLARNAVAPRVPPGEPAVARIVGIDRLDYSKGIHERLLAFEQLLDRYPTFRRRVVFTQLLVPSRPGVAEYQALKRELDETVGRINGRFSDQGWTPIRYLVRTMSPAELGACYRYADVALVTPLRDGMNLVSKEYVASQITNDGVLILSELAGAAEELQEALLVNPFDTEAVADTLHRALTMPADEKRARMAALRDRVRANPVRHWVDTFLDAADAAAQRARLPAASPAERVRRRLAPWLAGRPTVALFLDYDGTLTALAERPEAAVLPESTRGALEQAARTPNLDTVIVTGRSLADIRERVGVASLTYVGNHGFEIEGPGISFRHEAMDRFGPALQAAAAELEAIGAAGAILERKGATLGYHVRGVEPRQQAAAARRAERVLRRHGLRPLRGKAVVEGRPPVVWDKGHAVLYVLVHRHGADWLSRVRALYVGDDLTDEDAFRSLRGIGRSVRVGEPPGAGPTLADHTLPDPEAVGQLLRWLAAGAFATPG